jgi:Lamin Tail Domain
MATPPHVLPQQLTFFKPGSVPVRETQSVGVTGGSGRFYVTVSDPPAGGPFWWPKPTSAPGWLLDATPPTHQYDDLAYARGTTYAVPGYYYSGPTVGIPVTFNPVDSQPANTTLTITVIETTGAPVPGFPVQVPIQGNADGVGDGCLKVSDVNANPKGNDLTATPGEYVELQNSSNRQLDLKGCKIMHSTFGRASGPALLIDFTFDLPLDPSKKLRVYTGTSASGDPALPGDVAEIFVNRGAPVWNNAGDTATVLNPSDHVVATFSYRTRDAFFGGVSPQATLIHQQEPSLLSVSTFPVAPTTTFMPTGIVVEDGDILGWSAFGWVWVAWATSQWGANPAGKEGSADAGWPAPDVAPYSLIGRIGPSGTIFFMGTGDRMFVRDEVGQLFIGINDIDPTDNWGPGFSCTISHTGVR